MRAVVGILIIFVGFFIEYSVFTGKLPPPGGIQPAQSSQQNLPTTNSLSGTTGQMSTNNGNTNANTPYNGPSVRGAF